MPVVKTVRIYGPQLIIQLALTSKVLFQKITVAKSANKSPTFNRTLRSASRSQQPLAHPALSRPLSPVQILIFYFFEIHYPPLHPLRLPSGFFLSGFAVRWFYSFFIVHVTVMSMCALFSICMYRISRFL
jgi:hypothetical protein